MPRRAAVLLALLAAAFAPAPARAALFHDGFNVRDGLLTNEYRYWNHLPSRDPRWQMTSGSLFARGGRGWTGHPDGCSSVTLKSSHRNSSLSPRMPTAPGAVIGAVAAATGLWLRTVRTRVEESVLEFEIEGCYLLPHGPLRQTDGRLVGVIWVDDPPRPGGASLSVLRWLRRISIQPKTESGRPPMRRPHAAAMVMTSQRT